MLLQLSSSEYCYRRPRDHCGLCAQGTAIPSANHAKTRIARKQTIAHEPRESWKKAKPWVHQTSALRRMMRAALENGH
jgi:hypothetical protein